MKGKRKRKKDDKRNDKAAQIMDAVRPELLQGITITPELLELIRVVTVPIVEALNDLADQVAELQAQLDRGRKPHNPHDDDIYVDGLIETLGGIAMMKERDKKGGMLH